MAKRPYFVVGNEKSIILEKEAEFMYSPGFAPSQKRKNVLALHEAISKISPEAKILEISTKSEIELGRQLSAFNLTWKIGDHHYPVECIFQGCKVFQKGGPYKDLIKGKPLQAKRDVRLKESGELKEFQFRGESWPLIPYSLFYDYVYINALMTHPELCEQVVHYDTFTDIEFNPNKSINCQARSVAIFVTLNRLNQLDKVSSQSLFSTLYSKQSVNNQEPLPFS